MKNYTSIQIVIGFLMGIILILIIRETERVKTDLPEEYELITPKTPIEGEYKDGVLVIKFKH